VGGEAKEAKELGAGEEPLFLPTPSFLASTDDEYEGVLRFPLFSFFVSLFRIIFLCNFLGALLIFLGQAWAEGKGKLATYGKLRPIMVSHY